MEKLKQYLVENNKKKFLDIGTGTGAFIAFIDSLYQEYDEFIGIDMLERAINMANEHNKNDKINFLVMDGTNTTFDDESFDVVTFSNSLHHVENIEDIFKEIKRILKKDGFVLVNEMINNDLNAMQKSHMLLHHFAAKIDRLYGDIHYETYSDKEIIDLLESRTNLQIEDTWKLDIPLQKENTEEEINYLLDLVERVFKKVKEEDVSSLIEEKEEIKQYIKENGYDRCTTMVTILTK